ncbi:hypothetical protein BV22DRAFT_718555 [Leucogyrophana mollusca]|uniref:Uncharacterized protein n=1 Tax=Leucogyrophana mollusca TaxID=85980 RepID=A0ACB8B9R7_9AGAM|nr:hypothetical protein BV22DRAFT_718555 [Leucogyrophana mollusca]
MVSVRTGARFIVAEVASWIKPHTASCSPLAILHLPLTHSSAKCQPPKQTPPHSTPDAEPCFHLPTASQRPPISRRGLRSGPPWLRRGVFHLVTTKVIKGAKALNITGAISNVTTTLRFGLPLMSFRHDLHFGTVCRCRTPACDSYQSSSTIRNLHPSWSTNLTNPPPAPLRKALHGRSSRTRAPIPLGRFEKPTLGTGVCSVR